MFVVAVEGFEGIELGDESLKCECAKVAAEVLIRGTAGAIVRLASGAQLLTLGRAAPSHLGGVLPFAFPAPLFEGDVLLLAGLRGRMEQQVGDVPPAEWSHRSLARVGDYPREILYQCVGGRPTSLKIHSDALSPGFLSGWCFFAKRRYASLISAQVAPRSRPRISYGSTRCGPILSSSVRGPASLQQSRHREHAAEDRERLCEHRTGEAPLQARPQGWRARRVSPPVSRDRRAWQPPGRHP